MLRLAQVLHFLLDGIIPTESQHTIHINNVKYENAFFWNNEAWEISHFPLCRIIPTEFQHTIHINNVKYVNAVIYKKIIMLKNISISEIDQNSELSCKNTLFGGQI